MFVQQQPGCALHRPPTFQSSTFNADRGAPFCDVWNSDALLRHSLEVPPSTFTGGLPVISSLPLPHDDQQLPNYRTISTILPTVSNTRVASPKPWYSQVTERKKIIFRFCLGCIVSAGMRNAGWFLRGYDFHLQYD